MEENAFSLKNKYGIRILKGCQSCKFNGKDTHPHECNARKDKTPCDKWELRRGLDNAGKGNGKVKRAEYLQFVLDRLSRSQTINISAEYLEDPESYMMSMRKEFQENHGKVYYRM